MIGNEQVATPVESETTRVAQGILAGRLAMSVRIVRIAPLVAVDSVRRTLSEDDIYFTVR